MRILYHGATEVIENPITKKGRKNLDFGQGFYVTDKKNQAQKWAERMARQRLEQGVISVYHFNDELASKKYKLLKFEQYDIAWLQFIVKCRQGYCPSEEYDYIEGGIANDRVIDTVEGFINGTIDAQHALNELSKHQPNNQICFLCQDLIDECLSFSEALNI